MCGGNVQPLWVEIRPDRAITVPVEKVTFLQAVEKQRANSPTLRRRLL
jgi:hypothetical protein